MHTLDIDLLRTFVAIADRGSFTRAADEVAKTQSAVSMQMKRLEQAVGRPLFVRNGRRSRLTADGERLLDYARRMVRLNNEAMNAFTRPGISGRVRIGTPDDYADRFLPEIMARFARSHPQVQVEVECHVSMELMGRVNDGELDLAIITRGGNLPPGDVIRVEQLRWVTSMRHDAHHEEVVPLAASHPGCVWRKMALDALETAGRRYRIAYQSANSMAIAAAVTSGLAVAAIPEITLRPGMRVLGEDEGFPALGTFEIGLIRSTRNTTSAVEALAAHVRDSVSDLGSLMVAAE